MSSNSECRDAARRVEIKGGNGRVEGGGGESKDENGIVGRVGVLWRSEGKPKGGIILKRT